MYVHIFSVLADLLTALDQTSIQEASQPAIGQSGTSQEPVTSEIPPLIITEEPPSAAIQEAPPITTQEPQSTTIQEPPSSTSHEPLKIIHYYYNI
jgi:hypothetical protein